MTLTIAFRSNNDFAADDVRMAVTDALDRERRQAEGRRDFFARECVRYEAQYGMTSDEFMRAFESGDLGDDEPFFDWFGAKRAFDIWDRQLRILSGVSIELS
jgi:hypothetical protein